MIDFSKATEDELEVVAFEDEHASVIDKAHALIQLEHRQEQTDLYEFL